LKVKCHTLEKSHSRRQEDRHDPELCSAREAAIERIYEEDKDKVDVEYRDGREDNLETPNPDGENGTLTIEQVQLSG
jgi:hypothetical protein